MGRYAQQNMKRLRQQSPTKVVATGCVTVQRDEFCTASSGNTFLGARPLRTRANRAFRSTRPLGFLQIAVRRTPFPQPFNGGA
jgi:hypothetical protein